MDYKEDINFYDSGDEEVEHNPTGEDQKLCEVSEKTRVILVQSCSKRAPNSIMRKVRSAQLKAMRTSIPKEGSRDQPFFFGRAPPPVAVEKQTIKGSAGTNTNLEGTASTTTNPTKRRTIHQKKSAMAPWSFGLDDQYPIDMILSFSVNKIRIEA